MDYAYKIYKITHRKICLRCCRVNVFNNECNREKDEDGSPRRLVKRIQQWRESVSVVRFSWLISGQIVLSYHLVPFNQL